MRKGQSPFVTGIVLCLVTVYLIVYFSMKGMWNAGTVIALVLIAVVAVFQFIIHFKFFRQEQKGKSGNIKSHRNAPRNNERNT